MSNKTATAYIGTYTKVESKGIYRLVMDRETGEVLENKHAGTMDNPTYLKISDDEKYLYSVAKDGDKGGLAAFKINEDGSLALLNEQVKTGNPPCYVDASADNSIVVSANYHLGTILSYPTENGALGAPISEIEHTGKSVHERQEKPHAHFAGFTPDQKFVVTCDLGTDFVTTYSATSGKLEKVADLLLTPGSGPRNLVFHPNAKYLYIMTELTSEVVVAEYNSTSGELTVVQTIPSLPADFTAENKGSAIHISNDGRFLYVSNRGQDAIVSFAIDKTGQLSLLETVPVLGVGPRDFDLDKTGEILVATNENSNNVTIFSVNKETGKLTLLQKDIKVPEPVCVKFMK
ncbi:lactonase family protein [Listeria sp. ILCC797]|uniref:lactonase family protein n=1 Tax=Listeria sp. ILCC797 TaxID=1918333 RepID=UPI000B591B2C|nr:lactonase family protein [Listeria sp. ILCC797]